MIDYPARPIRYWAVALCFVIGCLIASPQNDNELWASIEAEKDLTPRFRIELEQEIRLNDHLSSFKETFSQISLTYGIVKNIQWSGDYRLIVYSDEIEGRVSTGVTHSGATGPLSHTYRVKFQRESGRKSSLEDHLRNRLIVRYRIRKSFSPYVGAETFHEVGREGFEYDKFRITIGMRAKFTGGNSARVFYRLQRQVGRSNPKSANIFGIKYEIDF